VSDGGVVLRKGDNDGSLFEHDGLSFKTGELVRVMLVYVSFYLT